jgi:hypothetical protein
VSGLVFGSLYGEYGAIATSVQMKGGTEYGCRLLHDERVTKREETSVE